VKLATWNCCGQFSTNLPHLLDLGVDVAVVCEASARADWPATADGRPVTGLSRRVRASWKELAVIGCAPWSVSPHEAGESAPPWTLPARIVGPTPFTLVALWPVAFPGAPGYVAQIDRAVDWIEQNFGDESVVLAGDFNAPIASTRAQYETVARRLEKLGLFDAYGVSRGLEPGETPVEATYYHHRRLEQPFHIDHIVLPVDWAETAKVEIGDFETWVATGRSDHVPLLAEIGVSSLH
jgi:exodeoxyribonuclease-3